MSKQIDRVEILCSTPHIIGHFRMLFEANLLPSDWGN